MCCVLLLGVLKQHVDVFLNLMLYVTSDFCPRLVAAAVHSLKPLTFCFTWLVIGIN